ncbi:MAG: hypothetical protein WCB27_21315 [Thermoguttaceae bacterium]
MCDALQREYEARLTALEELKNSLQAETTRVLAEVQHIDRVSFRVKVVKSFVEKATDPDNNPPYTHPLREIEDQVAGRVLVFFLQDIDPVCQRLRQVFTAVESSRRKPKKDEEFGYESHHLICVIPSAVKPGTWSDFRDMPTTFELQVRTLFMHAWAEPQHDLGYKGPGDLPPNIRRELAWVAASAWGADQAFSRVSAWNTAKEHTQ